MGLLQRLRVRLGNEVHARYRERRSDALGDRFTAEIPLRLERELEGFDVLVRGRADGRIDTGDEVIVEEVKSVMLTATEIAALDPDELNAFTTQAGIYALCIEASGETRPVRARVVLESLVDGTIHEVDADYERHVMAGRVDRLLRRVIAEAERERDRANLRAALADRLRFPYSEPRPHQGRLIEGLEQALATGRPALAMAPTGIGKTCSSLLPAMKHALANDASVYFATATITQRDLVARTFVDIAEAAELPAHQITALTMRAKERMCPPGTLTCHPEHCTYLADYDRRVGPSGVIEALRSEHLHIGPDDVFEAAEHAGLCPFEVSLDIGEAAELVIGDYNYVFDQSYQDDGADPHPRIVIVDEAHNLFDRARGYESPFIAAETVRAVHADVLEGAYAAGGGQEVKQLELTMVGTSSPKLFDRCARLLEIMARYVDRGGDAEEFAVEADLDQWEAFAEVATDLLIQYALYKRRHQLVRPGDPLQALLCEIVRVRDLLATERPELIAYGAGPEARNGSGVGVLCVNPALPLEACHRRALGTIAMSATLTPLSYYADVLGFAPLDPAIISVPSPFPEQNRRVLLIPSISTTYRQRDRHAGAVASLIGKVTAVRPGNYVAFFPSYAYLAQVRRLLEIPANRLIVQSSAMAPAARNRALDQMRTERNRLLLAVMGGSFAEGVDLPGESLVGAIVVGPALPPVGFERAAMRSYFDTHGGGQGFAYAMLYPGMQRVIQAAGRVIRSMDDRGIIVLVGNRFARPLYARCLPEHWYRYDPRELIANDPLRALETFWRDQPEASRLAPFSASPL